MVEKEVRFRKAIERANISRFQQLIGYSSSCDNLVQAPFIALSWTDGVRLQWTDQSPADEGDRNKVISSIAQATIDLLSVRSIGKFQIDAHHSGCYADPAQACSAREYITTKIDRKLLRAEKGELRGGTVAECLEQKRLIQDYWLPQLDDAFHVLVHGDLSANNVIVDEHFNVKCVIDLGWADFVPLQFAAVYPRFLTHEPSWNGRMVKWPKESSPMMRRDREFYLQCVHQRAVAEGGMVEDYYRVLSREDEIQRYWWIAAASQIDIHIAMASCNWAPHASGKDISDCVGAPNRNADEMLPGSFDVRLGGRTD
ncbi:MAG: hypothetical protein Q9196_006805 [Gyalolechia fulgens]